ncbi:acyltransferase [Deinococcus sp. DB0503]|uniref:acyltransferase family protein n=1 Tax=Deinococcus sp. DB0503 TaxID=2479203 RepID=UPI0018DF312F|nr:hypothetical protein [Deinococcus sp. DB0503]MBI0446540.1 hypothetical protein [Deinococcus sp. DB0503]
MTVLVLAVLSASPLLPYPLLHNGLLAGFYALLILALASVQKGVMTNRTLVLLGESSYALYLLHFPLWFLFLRVLGHLGIPATSGWVFAVYLLGMVLASIAAHRLIELPMQRWLLQLGKPRLSTARR